MYERACLLSLSKTPDIQPCAGFLLHLRGGERRDSSRALSVFLSAEATLATLSVLRYCQGPGHAQFGARHRLCGIGSRNRTPAPVRDKNPPPWGRAFLPRGMTTRHLTFHRDETVHRPSPPSVPPNSAARPMHCVPRRTLRQFSAATTSPAPARLRRASTSGRH